MANLLKRGFVGLHDLSTRLLYGKEKEIAKMSFSQLVDKDMSGNQVKMSDFIGNVLLVVNVASK